MEPIASLFGQPQAQAVVTALVIQAIIWLLTWLFQRRPRITYSRTSFRHLNLPQPPPMQQPLPVEAEIEHQPNEQQAPEESGRQTSPVEQREGALRNFALLQVQVAEYSIINQGRLPAKNLEVVFNYRPQHYDRHPHLPIKEAQLQDNRFVLTIGMLNPKERLAITTLDVGRPLPDLTLVRCEGHGAKEVRTVPQRVWPRWLNWMSMALLLIGVFSVLYLVSLLLISLFETSVISVS